jgi:hypothetical protein
MGPAWYCAMLHARMMVLPGTGPYCMVLPGAGRLCTLEPSGTGMRSTGPPCTVRAAQPSWQYHRTLPGTVASDTAWYCAISCNLVLCRWILHGTVPIEATWYCAMLCCKVLQHESSISSESGRPLPSILERSSRPLTWQSIYLFASLVQSCTLPPAAACYVPLPVLVGHPLVLSGAAATLRSMQGVPPPTD